MTRTVAVFVAMAEEAAPFLARGHTQGPEQVLGGARVQPLRIGERDVLLVTTGIGLVNAAAAGAVVASGFTPDALISAGSAGGLGDGVRVGDVVVGLAYAYARADARAFGYVMGQVPGMPATFAADHRLVGAAQGYEGELSVHVGEVVSGDTFVDGPLVDEVRRDFPAALATDMESAALAHTAHLFDVPFVSVRGISDLCGVVEFAEHVDDAADRAAQVVVGLLDRLA
ncbi:MAG TPA: 5'-methylthioadenosine/S-adenosylhomocysteine nucleosidase [Cellulomonas sp.]